MGRRERKRRNPWSLKECQEERRMYIMKELKSSSTWGAVLVSRLNDGCQGFRSQILALAAATQASI
jgi:hypothetical protein